MKGNISGKLAIIEDAQLIGSFKKVYKRRCVIYSSDGPMVIDFIHGEVELLDGFEVGDKVEVYCVLEGREWRKSEAHKKQYFLSLRGMEITRK